MGGLEEVHGELAMEAASARARDLLLFVVDASAPFTHPRELEFLQKASERVETVVFALAKTDQFRGWRQVLDEDRKLLASTPAVRRGAIFPVSARLQEMAGKAPNEQRRSAAGGEKSGIAELRSELERLIGGRSRMLGEANTSAHCPLCSVNWWCGWRARSARSPSARTRRESLRARRDELTASRRSSTRGWQVKLRGEVLSARSPRGDQPRGVTPPGPRRAELVPPPPRIDRHRPPAARRQCPARWTWRCRWRPRASPPRCPSG
ncbi:hypothetical protein GCM10023108_54740 [Saccharopolyspora hordei]